MNIELKKIKQLYGEEFMHFCRSRFSTILETPGLLLNTLRKIIYPTKTLYFDISNQLFQFEKYIYSLFNDVEIKKDRIKFFRL